LRWPAHDIAGSTDAEAHYGNVVAIESVDLEIADGEFIVFVGPSGCGKSTLMRMIAGLEDITAGEIAIDGRVVNDLAPRERDIAMVFQDYALYPNKTVRENMAFGLRLRGTPDAEIARRVEAAAELLQLTPLLARLPKALSGGQRQRVAMGRAMVRDPKVFLFDEPLSNLDALLRNQVRAEIKRLHQRVQGTVIYVTHDQVEAMTLADRIVVLQAGRIVQVGTPDEIYHWPRHRFVAEFTGSPPMNLVEVRVAGDAPATSMQWPGGQALPVDAATCTLLRPHAGGAVLAGIRPEHVHAATDRLPPNWPRLDLVVSLLEPLGAENVVHLALDASHELLARVPSTVRPPAGTAMTVALDAQALRWFDAASGVALGEPRADRQ
jgi:multiple sugar transport system ATP-binding protein